VQRVRSSALREMSLAFARRLARVLPRGCRACLLAFAVVAFAAGDAYAAVIAIWRPPEPSPELSEAVFRLQGELLALGLEVHVSARPSDSREAGADAGAWVEREARERDFDAVIDVVGDSPLAVEIWTRDGAGQRLQRTRVVLEPSANAAETLAIRAIEVLRSSFLEIHLSARARRRVSEPAPPPREAARSSPRPVERLGVEAGVAMLTSLDGVGPSLMPLVRLDLAVDASFAAEVTLAAFGTRPTLDSELGSADVAQQFGVLGLCYCVPVDSGVRPILGVAAGALRTSLSGRADAPERGHSVARWSFLAEARLGVRVGLSGGYHVALASHVHWAEPYVAIHFVDQLVASTGRPNLLLSLTLGARP
jgi:hypothetical protein